MLKKIVEMVMMVNKAERVDRYAGGRRDKNGNEGEALQCIIDLKTDI